MLTPESFIRIWQESSSIAEIVKKTGLSMSCCQARAFKYRKKGIPLKRFRILSSEHDWKALAKLAKSLEDGK